MTYSEIITEHLGPNWWDQQFDTTTLSVLLDRLRNDRGVRLRTAVWRILMEVEVELAAKKKLGRYDRDYSSRCEARQWVLDGHLETAWTSACAAVELGRATQHWAQWYRSLVETVRAIGLEPNELPED